MKSETYTPTKAEYAMWANFARGFVNFSEAEAAHLLRIEHSEDLRILRLYCAKRELVIIDRLLEEPTP